MREELPTFGEFLVSLDLISAEEARDMARLSSRLGMTFGELVLGCKRINTRQLNLLHETHSLLLDGIVEEPLARELALECFKTQCSLESLYAKHDIALGSPRFRLGDLLVATGVVSQKDIEPLLEKSQRNAKPLGHALIEARILSPEAVAAALNCQMDIRFKGKLPSDAISELKVLLSNPAELAEISAASF
ncbi:MAG: hypothetical protein K2W95_32600 [Candidatus Obscuribacterales bacterium]|nr:hypothetical protein [Candidatus Obscuribacterales bacterium]